MTADIHDRSTPDGTCTVCDHPAEQHARMAQWHCRECGGFCRAPAEERPAPASIGDGPQTQPPHQTPS